MPSESLFIGSQSISTRPTAFPHFLPNQLGVGVKGGCEEIIHTVSSHFFSSPSDRCWTLLVDFSIASIGKHVSGVHPLSLPLDRSCYSSQPNPLLGSHSLLSCSRVQQGDPLGLLGFALTLQPIIDCIQSEVPDLALNA